MKGFIVTVCLCFTLHWLNAQAYDYRDYHQKVIRCEQLIAENNIEAARQSLETLFDEFDFVFLRECQLATELSLYDGDHDSAFELLQLGILSGWTIQNIEKSPNLKSLKKDPRWDNLKADFDSLRGIYRSKLNMALREEAHEMLKADQKIALRVFIRIREKSKNKYAIKHFAPHSEIVLARLSEILEDQGYPGEKLIGNSWWTSVNLSHHNSINTAYTAKDTLYPNLRPQLLKALEKGELHPNEFAIMEDWRNGSIQDETLYAFVGEIQDSTTLAIVNQNREKIGLRSIELRNRLLDIEQETGMNLYLPKGWNKGKITITNE